ncbi:MFS transporter [Brucella sp. NBRC 113783]|uniref:MFS transporter n=1 Tax=Brucella sp. NBRC 113783 TaxID=3075478 RepID=UPI0029BFD947|nr:MFS transporter [Brucella sp. NBRC 113783]MDX4075594.1 MFS transporter [Brucella sp. NBRC 113783]
MPLNFNSRRFALFVLFFLPGLGHASWATRTPALRDALTASTEQMGFILFGPSIGSLSGILASGALTTRFGTRNVIRLGLLTLSAGLALTALSAEGELAALAFAGLFLFGIGVGWMEVAINVEGALLEEISGKSIMPALHGCFSLGTFVGAMIGMGMSHLAVSVVAHVSGIAAVTLCITLYFVRFVPVHKSSPDHASKQSSFGAVIVKELKDLRLMLIGLFVLGLALAEGSANDWLPLLMVDDYGVRQPIESAVFVIFACSMTIGRFAGGFAVDRFGEKVVARMSAASAAVGLLLVIIAPHPLIAAAAVAFWGLGAALGFPLAISAGASSGRNSAVRVSLVATIGYLAFLVGPPSLGLLGEHFGLRIAFLPVFGLACIAILAAASIGRRRGSTESQLGEAA